MKDLRKLLILTELKYQASQNDLRVLVQEEQRIRNEIARLTENAHQVDAGTADRMGAIGADVIWHAWVGRMKKQLNQQLAQVLAKKERYLTVARREFSRVLVARELKTKHEFETEKSVAKAKLEETVETSLIRRLGTNDP